MAVTLEDLKNYLKVDADITEDDELLKSMMAAAVDYIEQLTGKKFNEDAELFNIAERELILQWYENRTSYTTKTSLNELPHSLSAILKHISLAQHYESLDEGAAT